MNTIEIKNISKKINEQSNLKYFSQPLIQKFSENLWDIHFQQKKYFQRSISNYHG